MTARATRGVANSHINIWRLQVLQCVPSITDPPPSSERSIDASNNLPKQLRSRWSPSNRNANIRRNEAERFFEQTAGVQNETNKTALGLKKIKKKLKAPNELPLTFPGPPTTYQGPDAIQCVKTHPSAKCNKYCIPKLLENPRVVFVRVACFFIILSHLVLVPPRRSPSSRRSWLILT